MQEDIVRNSFALFFVELLQHLLPEHATQLSGPKNLENGRI